MERGVLFHFSFVSGWSMVSPVISRNFEVEATLITTVAVVKNQLSIPVLMLYGLGSIWTSSLMARNVNKALPFGVEPFSRIVVKQRLFELFRLHRQLFPKNWLPELLALQFIFVAGFVIVTGWFSL
jgi:hypothetical protein